MTCNMVDPIKINVYIERTGGRKDGGGGERKEVVNLNRYYRQDCCAPFAMNVLALGASYVNKTQLRGNGLMGSRDAFMRVRREVASD